MHAAPAWAWWLVAAGTLGLALCILVPWSPPRLAAAESWVLVLHDAFSRRLAFGRDLVFTYGPWGFLNSPIYHPATFPALLAGRAFLAVVWWWAGWRIARDLLGRPWIALLWLGTTILVSGLAPRGAVGMIGTDFLFYGLPSALLVLRFFTRADRWTESAVVLGLALVCLVKTSFLVPAAAVVGVIAFDDARARRLPTTPLVLGGGLLAFWLLAGQRLEAVPDFVRNSAGIVSGYSAGMALDVAGGAGHLDLFVAAAAVTLLVAALGAARRLRVRAVAPIAAQLVVLLVLFKAGFVRHDQHEVLASIALLLQCVLWLPVWTARPLAWLLPVAIVGVLADGTLRVWTGNPLGRAITNVVPAGGPPLRQRHEEDLAILRRRFPLPPLAGSVDVYPWNEDLVLAHGLAYAPRPVVESYSAYTPRLAELNAAHLRGNGAPDFVLFDVRSLDSRFPSMDDGLSWPEILSRYDLDSETESFLVFRRRARPRTYRLRPLLQTEARCGEPLRLPAAAGRALWLRMEMTQSAWGRLMTALYKPSAVFMGVRTRAGPAGTYRIIPEEARAGFLLSPFIDDRRSLARLTRPAWADALAQAEVTSLRLICQARAFPELEPRIAVSLLELEIAPE